MAKGKSFNDFTYGVGLEVNASSFKQVKDDLKLNLDNLGKMVKSYGKILKIDPNADLSILFEEFRKLQSVVDGINKSDNPLSGFVDKGVLSRIVALENSMVSLSTTSKEIQDNLAGLKTSMSGIADAFKSIGAEKFPATLDNLLGNFQDKSEDIKKTTNQIEILDKIIKKVNETRKAFDDASALDLGQNKGLSNFDGYNKLVTRFKELHAELLSADPGKLEALSKEFQSVINELLNVYNQMSSKQFSNDKVVKHYSAFLQGIDNVLISISSKRKELSQELTLLQSDQAKYNSQLPAKGKSLGIQSDYTAQVKVTPKTNDAEWINKINDTIKNIEPQIARIAIQPTFIHGSKNVKKELGQDSSQITHTVNAKIDVVDNLGDFQTRIDNIDKLIKSAKKRLEESTKFKVSFQYEDGERFKDVVLSVVKDLKNINATIKLTNGKSFKGEIDKLKSSAKDKLKDIPATFVVGDTTGFLSNIDSLKSDIDKKIGNIGVNLNLQNIPEFMAQAALMRDSIEEYYDKNPIDRSSTPINVGAQPDSAAKEIEELSETAKQAKKEIEDCDKQLKSLMSNKFDAPEFLSLGDIDPKGKKIKGSTKKLEELRKQYKDLQSNAAKGGSQSELKKVENELGIYYQKQIAYLQARQELAKQILQTEKQQTSEVKKQQDVINSGKSSRNNVADTTTNLKSLRGKVGYAQKVLNDLKKGWEKSSSFVKLGEWDEASGKFKENSKHIQELIDKYNKLRDARLAANKESGKKTRASGDELKTKKILDDIYKSQLQHQNEILEKQKQELELAKKIAVEKKPREDKKTQTVVSKKSLEEFNKAMQQQEELQKKLETSRLIWSDINKTNFDNGNISTYFTKLGEWDEEQKKFKRNTSEIQDLINKYQELRSARLALGSNEPIEEEIALRQRLDTILESQKKHVVDYGQEFKSEFNKIQELIVKETSTGTVDKQLSNTESYIKNLTERLNKAKEVAELLSKKRKNFNDLTKTGLGDSLTHVLGEGSTNADLEKQIKAYNKLSKEQAALRKNGQTQTSEYKTNAKLLRDLKTQLESVYSAQLEYAKTRKAALTEEIKKEEEKKQKLIEQKQLIEQQQKDQTKANANAKQPKKTQSSAAKTSGAEKSADISSPVVQLDSATLTSLAKDATLRNIDGKVGNILQSIGKGIKVTSVKGSVASDNIKADSSKNSGVQSKKQESDNNKFARHLAQEMSKVSSVGVYRDGKGVVKRVDTYRSSDRVREQQEVYQLTKRNKNDAGSLQHVSTILKTNNDAYNKLYQNYVKSLTKQFEIEKKIQTASGSTLKLQEELKIRQKITSSLDSQLSKYTELFSAQSKQAAQVEAEKIAQDNIAKYNAEKDDSGINQQIKKLKKTIDTIETSYNHMLSVQNEFKSLKVDGIDASLSDAALDKVEHYKDLLDQLKSKQAEIASNPSLLNDKDYGDNLTNLLNDLKKTEKQFDDLHQSATEFFSRINNTSGDIHILDQGFNPNDIDQMHDAMRRFANGVGEGEAKLIGFNDKNRTATFEIKNSKGELQQLTIEYNEATNALGRYITKTKESTSGFQKFFEGIKHSFGNVVRYLASFGSVYEIFAIIKQGVQYVREIDSALTELKKVTNETNATYDAFLQNMSKTAGVVGSTVSDLTTMAAEWARLNI